MHNRSPRRPINWIIITLVIVGLAGLAYYLTRPKTGAAGGSSKTGAAGFLGNLFGPAKAGSVPTQGVAGFLNTLLGGNTDPAQHTTALPTSYFAGGSPTYAVDSTDRGGGNYTANPDWIVGDYGAPQGVDYLGNAFVRQSAPTIPFEVKNRPYRHGVDYDFADQTAKGVALFKRFPEFQLTDHRIHMQGPWYSDPDANAHFSRGVATMFAMPSVRTGPTNVMNLPRERKNVMINDDAFWVYANNLANELGDGDSKTYAMRQLVDNHLFVADEQAYKLLGRRVWQGERNAFDAQGQGTLYMSIDMEQTGPFDLHQSCSGWIYMGYCGAAAEDGFTVHPYLYSEGTQQVGIHYISGHYGGNGEIEYLMPEHDFLGNNTPVIQACQEFGGVLAIDTYLQAIWGLEPLLARDADGSPVLGADGRMVSSDLTQTTAYGVAITLEFEEAEKCLRDLYEQSNRLYLQQHRLAGQYPHTGGMRRDYLTNTESGAFTRFTNENVQGINQEGRPVPAWQLGLFNALNQFLSQNTWCWGVDFNHTPTALGADQSGSYPSDAHGVAETIVRSAHRHSAFSNIQASPFKWCWFNLAIVNDMNPATGDGYHQKALCHGKIRNVNGTAWLEVLLAFPATDNRSTLFQVWVKQGELQTVAYQCELQSGRHYFYDAWPLPQSFSYDTLEGANVFVTYPDTLDVQRTHAGDYRVDASGAVVPVSQTTGGGGSGTQA